MLTLRSKSFPAANALVESESRTAAESKLDLFIPLRIFNAKPEVSIIILDKKTVIPIEAICPSLPRLMVYAFLGLSGFSAYKRIYIMGGKIRVP